MRRDETRFTGHVLSVQQSVRPTIYKHKCRSHGTQKRHKKSSPDLFLTVSRNCFAVNQETAAS